MIPDTAFAVALKDPAAEPLAAAVFLSGVRGYTRDSARAFLKRQPGFLGRNLGLAAARELKDSAAAAGFDALLADEAEIPAGPPPVKTAKIEPKGAGFYAQAGGAIKFVSYGSVTLFTAAAFDAPVPPVNLSALEAGLFEKTRRLAGAPSAPVAAALQRETFFRADIICEGGLLRLGLEPDNLDFSPLGAERSLSGLENFRKLLNRVSGPCFKAVKNSFLAAFLSGSPLTQLKLASPEACGAELSRLLLVTAKRAA